MFDKNEGEFTMKELGDKSNEICSKENLTREDVWDFVKKLTDLELKFLIGNCYLKLNKINTNSNLKFEDIQTIIKFVLLEKDK
jgi:hypothetical protein